MARKKHFQHGSLIKRGKRIRVWVARFWERIIGQNGESYRVRRSEILGTVIDLPTRRDAQMVLSDRLRRVNSADYHPALVLSISFLCPGVGSASSPHSQVCNPGALQVHRQLSPAACVRECPASLDFAGIDSDVSRR